MTTAGLTLEDIHSLSDEVALLVRAGLPLEHNLASAGRGHGLRLKQATAEISDALSSGRSLQEVMQQQRSRASRMLAAAVAAGTQTGDLATTIEMMGEFAGDLVELRRQILNAIAYPLTILAVAWGLFFVILHHALIKMLDTIQDLEIRVSSALMFLLELNRDQSQWLLLIPVVGVVLVAVWMISGRASSMAFRGPERLFLLFPGTGTLIRNLQFYTLSRMLSLLVEKQLPLADALRLAGATCGSPGLDAACSRAADQMVAGNVGGSATTNAGSRNTWQKGQLPPLVQVCLSQTSLEADRMLVRLKSITQYYRNRLDNQAAWLRMVMPFVLLLVMGGGAVLLYSTAIFWPIIELYGNLGTEKG